METVDFKQIRNELIEKRSWKLSKSQLLNKIVIAIITSQLEKIEKIKNDKKTYDIVNNLITEFVNDIIKDKDNQKKIYKKAKNIISTINNLLENKDKIITDEEINNIKLVISTAIEENNEKIWINEVQIIKWLVDNLITVPYIIQNQITYESYNAKDKDLNTINTANRIIKELLYNKNFINEILNQEKNKKKWDTYKNKDLINLYKEKYNFKK